MVITTIEVEAGHLSSSTAAAPVGAGMLSVLVFPLAARRVRGGVRPPVPSASPASPASSVEVEVEVELEAAADAGRPRVRAESW
ncbi:hypothetical protein [Streptomyces sp. FH025]|uniref:hypothetical protein n=1 Tax=Streptomyces sp. FH025 TaxID=2815937 RepID=UPI001A9E5000|nr:hypothetical protein [Streptomyces sp. FH025]MBO1419815.1 hypothetical protein [Streptomyces sp. FH025]